MLRVAGAGALHADVDQRLGGCLDGPGPDRMAVIERPLVLHSTLGGLMRKIAYRGLKFVAGRGVHCLAAEVAHRLENAHGSVIVLAKRLAPLLGLHLGFGRALAMGCIGSSMHIG